MCVDGVDVVGECLCVSWLFDCVGFCCLGVFMIVVVAVAASD